MNQACRNNRQVTEKKRRPMQTVLILKLRSTFGLAIFSFLIFSSLIANAGVIAERKANFKAVHLPMKKRL